MHAPHGIMTSFRSLLVALLAAVIVAGCSATPPARVDSDVTASLMAQHRQWVGTPYRLGGDSRRGIDCSAYVQTLYRDVYRVRLPRSTEDQEDVGRRVSRDRLRPGDLVFFKTGWFKRHVGVYVSGGRFIHASESRGVTESSLASPYWSKHYWKARRVL